LTTFSIVGGDKRNIFLKELLEDDGHKVKIYGFCDYKTKDLKNSKTLEDAIKDTDFIISSIPFTNKEGWLIFAPFSKEVIPYYDILQLMNSKQKLVAGSINKDIMKTAKDKGIEFIDILKNEEINILNAVPTAEGIIKIAIEETEITLCTANIMILGYGRIGSVTAHMLKGMGANVLVVTNRIFDSNRGKSFGHRVIDYSDINDHLMDMDIIINTANNNVINSKNFIYISEDTLLIDVSSPPFGINMEDSFKFGAKTLWARALPGKIAPKSVAMYIRDGLYKIIDAQ